jgi:hypothetical protein
MIAPNKPTGMMAETYSKSKTNSITKREQESPNAGVVFNRKSGGKPTFLT